jgi:hypothetical protein
MAIEWRLEGQTKGPRGNIGARQAGINRERRRKKPSSSTAGNNAGKACRFRVQCTQCPMEPGGDTAYVYVSGTAKKAVCKNGHLVDCSGGCKIAA